MGADPANCSYRLPVTNALCWARQRGATLVEYAFVLILFLTVIFGIGGFGHALFVYHFLNQAAKEATRYAAVRGSTCYTGDKTCTAAFNTSGVQGPTTTNDLLLYVQSITPQSIDSSQLVIPAANKTGTSGLCGVSDVAIACSDSTYTVCSTAIGSGVTAEGPTPNAPGCTVRVTIAYAYKFIFPFLPDRSTVSAPCTKPGICLSSTSEMIISH